MTNHYYNINLETKSEETHFKITLLKHELTFFTDHGVFSKDTVDYGTRVLIKNVRVEPWYRRILDVGCGYGPLGISLAKEFPDVGFDLSDVNLRALKLAQRNAEINNLQNITVFESNIYEKMNTNYDCILSNPPIRAGKDTVHAILGESIRFLNPGGSIYIVIQKKQGAPSAKEKLEAVFGNCEIVERDKGYYVLKSTKNC